MTGLKRMRVEIVVVMLVAMLPLLIGGCYGPFPLTKKIHEFNGEVSENKWVKTIVFWVFIIIPVYGIGMFADAIVFNLVEFWTGEALMTATTTTDSNGNTVVLAPGENADEAILTISRDGEILAEEHFVRITDTLIEVRGADGALHGKVIRDTDGNFVLTDANGATVQTVWADSLAALNVN